MRYNLLPFTDTNIVICKIIVDGRTQFAPTKRLVRLRRGDLWSPVKCIVKGDRNMKATGIVRRVEECVIIAQKLSKPV